jgi:MraZ protein
MISHLNLEAVKIAPDGLAGVRGAVASSTRPVRGSGCGEIRVSFVKARGAAMKLSRPFLATFVNRIDAKGRVSVPAKFREILDAQGARSIFCRASTANPAIAAGGPDWMAGLYTMIDEHDPSSEAHDDFAYTLLGDTVELSLDSEGRIGLPDELARHAQLEDAAAFVGLGGYFELWEPRALELRKVQARRATAERRGQLKPKNGGGAP